MSIHLISILLLVVAFVIATTLPINLGAIALVAAFIVGTIVLEGPPDDVADGVVAGFPGGLLCHTGCIFGAKNTLTTNYLASAERAGVRVRPNRQAEQVRRSDPNASGYRYVVTASLMDNEGPAPTRQPQGSEEIECKVLILAAGAMGTPPILMRSRTALPSLSPHVGLHLGSNGDHVAALEYDPAKVRRQLGLPGYGQFHKGKPITTMTYDFWAGRRAHRFDGTRFTLQEIFLSSLTNFLYDDGREPAGEPSFWGAQKKRSVARWSDRIELLAMVEDTMDGRFELVPPQGGRYAPTRARSWWARSRMSSPSSRCGCASWPSARWRRWASAGASPSCSS